LRVRLTPAWAMALGALGYALAPHVIDAADLAVPQHRRRLYVVCARSRHVPTLKIAHQPHQATRNVIRWGAGPKVMTKLVRAIQAA